MHIEGKNRTFDGKGLDVGVHAFSETWVRTSSPSNSVSRSPAKNHFFLKRSGSGQIISPNGVFPLKQILNFNHPKLSCFIGFRRLLKLF